MEYTEQTYHKGRARTNDAEMLRRKRISERMKGNTNWERNKRRGNGKKGTYKGIYCDSAWELAYLVYHVEHGLFIKRCTIRLPFIWNGEEHIYIPDFETNDGIIEIKGRKSNKSLEKEKQYPNIKVVDADGIKPYIEYCVKKYGGDFYKKLYDDKEYRDEHRMITLHNNVCVHCGSEFQSVRRHQKYCSFSCYSDSMKRQSITKQELIDAFKTYKSFTNVSKLYDVSDKSIVKWCMKCGLPHKKKELYRYIESMNH